jgi:hypothetical protein
MEGIYGAHNRTSPVLPTVSTALKLHGNNELFANRISKLVLFAKVQNGKLEMYVTYK